MPSNDPPNQRFPSHRTIVGSTHRSAARLGSPRPGPPRAPEFPGPILSGQVAVPTRRERRRATKKRRRPAERVLRGLVGVVVVVVVVAALGYGYFRYQWSKVSSAPCTTCVAAANGAPYNVLLIGSDSRVGETAAEAQQFGNATNAGGQRSDTIKIVHVDPSTGTASTLSIPRDTYVTLSGMPANTGSPARTRSTPPSRAGPTPSSRPSRTPSASPSATTS